MIIPIHAVCPLAICFSSWISNAQTEANLDEWTKITQPDVLYTAVQKAVKDVRGIVDVGSRKKVVASVVNCHGTYGPCAYHHTRAIHTYKHMYHSVV